MTTPTLQEQIEWLETQVRWAEAEADTPTALRLDAILSQLRRIEAAEKEMPPEAHAAPYAGILIVKKADYDALRAYALAQKALLQEIGFVQEINGKYCFYETDPRLVHDSGKPVLRVYGRIEKKVRDT